DSSGAGRLLLLLLIGALLLAGCSAPLGPEGATPASDATSEADAEAPASAPDEGEGLVGAAVLRPVALGVGFVPNVQFAPLYVGIERGFFTQEGVDLALEYGFENDYLALVGTGAYQFMIGSGDQVVIGRSQGLPVRSVAEWYTSYPVVAFGLPESGLAGFADLEGKRVGLPGPFGANYVALRAMLDAAGLDEADIQMESIGFTQAAAVSEGLVEVAIDYAANGPVVLAQAGIATVQIGMEGTTPIPANGLVTNERTIAEDPALVQAVVNGMLRSIAWTLENPDEAFAIALKYVPEAGGANEVANRAVFDASLPYWTPAPGATPGAASAADWAAASEFLAEIGLAPSAPPADELFTNQFVAP
ncbi:MAG: ABC transporter substrate-binding protein, partial [Caldilineaceae bacterium]